nr:hypothetical protein [uncultured Vibrio sp.]
MGFFKLLKNAAEHWASAQEEISKLPQSIKEARERSQAEREKLEPASSLAYSAKMNYYNVATMTIQVPTQYEETHKVLQVILDCLSKIEELANAAKNENAVTQKLLLSLAEHLNQNEQLKLPNLYNVLLSDFPLEKLQAQGFQFSEAAKDNPNLQKIEITEYIYKNEGTKLEKGYKDLNPQANSALESFNTLIKAINVTATNKIKPVKLIPTKQAKKKNESDTKPHPMLTTPIPFSHCNATKKQQPTINELLFPPTEHFETPFQSGDLTKIIDYEFMIGEYSVIFNQYIGKNQVDVTIEKFHICNTSNGKYSLTEPQATVFHKLIVKPYMAKPNEFHPEHENVRTLLKRFKHCKKEGDFEHGIFT